MLASYEDWQKLSAEMRRDLKNAEYFLLNYEQEMRSYEDAKEESKALPCAHDEKAGTRRGSMAGHPTEANALKNVMFDDTYPAYPWLKAVEIVQRGLGERKLIFLQVRRMAERQHRGRGRKAWVVFVQNRYIDAVQRRYLSDMTYVSEKTVRLWWRDIVRRTVEIYCRLNDKK